MKILLKATRYSFMDLNIETKKVDDFLTIGCESDNSREKDKLFIFWSNVFIYKEIELRKFKISECPFMALGKRTNFLKIQKVSY